MLNTEIKINPEIYLKDAELKSCRDGFGEAIVEAAESNNNIVVLTGDLRDSIKLGKFASRFPDRFIEMGIQEQNMTGVATGLALSGKIPFITSHAIFSPSTNWASLRLSVCFSDANVKVVGSHSGFSNGPDGGAAEPLEDISLMRVLPNMTILQPIDYMETKKALKAAAEYKGAVYIRLSKAETPQITTEETPFEIGKSLLLCKGTDVTIITSGPIAFEALLAARELKAKHKIEAEVLACATVKPLDITGILNSVSKTKNVVTLEEHQVIGGLGSAVAEILSENFPVPLKRIGVNNTFGESGSYKELKDKYRLSSHHVEETVLNLLKDK